MREKAIQAKILLALRKHGGWWLNFHGTSYSATGIPDIIGCYEGRFFAFEVKRPGGNVWSKVSSAQAETISALQACGATVAVVTSVQEALATFEVHCMSSTDTV